MSDRTTVGDRRAIVRAPRGPRHRSLVAPGVRGPGACALSWMQPPPPAWTSETDRRDRPSGPRHQRVVARLRDDPSRAGGASQVVPFDDDALVVVMVRHGSSELRRAAAFGRAAGGSMLVTRIRRAADVTPAIRASAGALLPPHARRQHPRSTLARRGIHGRRPRRRYVLDHLRRSLPGGGGPRRRERGAGMSRLVRER